MFLDRYEPHAAALRDRYEVSRAKYTERTPAGKDRERVTTVTGRFNLDHYRLDSESRIVELPGGHVQSVQRESTVRNRQYHFDVTQKGDGYALTSYEPNADGTTSALCFFCFPYADMWKQKTYLDVVRDPDTTVLGTRDVNWRGRPVTELRFEFSYRDHTDRTMKRGRAAYYFDPAARWVCVGERLIPEDPARDSTYYEFVYVYDPSGEWPVPVRRELWKLDEKRPEARTRTSVTEIEEYVPLPAVDEAEFRLSAFGLPEPAGVVWEKRTPRYLWFLAAAGAFAVLAVGFRYLARRRAAPDAAQPA